MYREKVYREGCWVTGERAVDVRTPELLLDGELGVAATVVGEFDNGEGVRR